MNDNAASGIQKARQTGQLRKDADVQAKKSSIGKRDSGTSGGLSNGSSSSSLTSSISKKNIRNSLNSKSTIKNDVEAKKRLNKNRQNINKAISVAEKIPVARKYAKVARLAEKVKGAKSKRSGLFGGLFGKNDSEPSNAEIEDANASEVKGEEYNPEDSEGRFSIKLDRKTKLIFLAIVLGITGSCIFLCIIFASAITGGAKESYLASHDNPSEAEIEEAYSKDENSDFSDSDNSTSSNNSNSPNGSSRIKSGSTSNKMIVGDSRGVHLCQYIGGGSWDDCNTLGMKKGGITYFPGNGKSYDWFKSTALPELKKHLNSNGKSTVFLYMGTNKLDDYANQAKGYASDLNQLAKDYSDANIIAVSETPIIDSKVPRPNYGNEYNDGNIVKFNNELKKQISNDVIYCDVYSKVKGSVDASDGIHYDKSSYQKIYNAMMNCIKNDTSSSNNSIKTYLAKAGVSESTFNNTKAEQLVVVESNGSSANISYYEKSNSGWTKDNSLNSSGYVGNGGTISASSHSESTPQTPKGLYSIGDAFYQGNKPNTKLSSFKITSNTYWVDDPNSKYYNKRVEGTKNKDWNSAEKMSDISVYKYGFVINFNMNPIKKGAGSAIFFHISNNRATQGCVAAPKDKVLAFLAKLDRTKRPYILII